MLPLVATGVLGGIDVLAYLVVDHKTRQPLLAAIAMSFVLVAAQLFHSVLDSILMFAGLFSGRATCTWADWARALAWSGFGNIIGAPGREEVPVRS